MGSYIKLERQQQQSSLDVIKVLENKQCHIKREEGEGYWNRVNDSEN
jgi:hypothetical protein